MGEVALRLENLTKRFGDVVALKDFSLDVERGQFTTLLGPSGCGKTTCLRIIAGFYEPDVGEVYLGERPITGLPPFKRNTTMVFQDYALFPHLNVFDNISYGLKIKKLARKEIEMKVRKVTDLVHLEGLEKRGIGMLSGGQQQRVALARALVVEPEVLLFDEPLSNLDAKLRVEVRTEIRQIQQRLGFTAIYVTHDHEEALCMSDKVVVMNAGIKIQEGAPFDIYFRPRNKFVADFMGMRNFLEGRISGVTSKGIFVDLGGKKKLLLNKVRGLKKSERILITSHADSISISKSPLKGINVLRGKIETGSFSGPNINYLVNVDGIKLSVRVPSLGHTRISEGENVYLALDRSKLHIIRG